MTVCPTCSVAVRTRCPDVLSGPSGRTYQNMDERERDMVALPRTGAHGVGNHWGGAPGVCVLRPWQAIGLLPKTVLRALGRGAEHPSGRRPPFSQSYFAFRRLGWLACPEPCLRRAT